MRRISPSEKPEPSISSILAVADPVEKVGGQRRRRTVGGAVLTQLDERETRLPP
jgi:hypothetical protein